MVKFLTWYYLVLAPIALVTAVLSFLRAGDTFTNEAVYTIFFVINLGAFGFYLWLKGKVKSQPAKPHILGIIFLPISLIILALSYILIYSLLF